MTQQPHTINVNGKSVDILIQPHPTSRKLSLRIVSGKKAIKVVCPPKYPVPEILAFVERQKDWITVQLEKQLETAPYQDGGDIPILGRSHKIVRLDPGSNLLSSKGVAWLESNQLYIKSHPEHLPRRVSDFLRKQIRYEINLRAHEKASRIDKSITSIRIKDTTSRWGSCSTKGNLNFSWRLIFSPEQVLDYVVAHEVAHLEHMNHSADFWSLVDQLTTARETSQKWLRDNGSKLLSFS